MKAILSVICSFFLFAGINCKLNENPVLEGMYGFDEVDSLIYSAIEDSAFPGAVLFAWKDGNIIHNNSYGHLTYDDSAAVVTNRTIFDIASLTKVIATTTAVMICYDRKLFKLDDPVVRFIPSFSANGKENITIKNLLLHNSGLPAFKRFYQNFSTAKEVINDIYSIELVYKTGSKTVYSDLGMIVLARIIEKVSGKSFDEFCEKEIFSPLEMTSTFFNPPDSLKYRIAPTELDTYWRNKLVWGEVHDETAYLLNGVAGHAGLFSTAEDIMKLMVKIVNPLSSDGISFIKASTIKLFTTQVSDENTRALGWDTKSEKNSSAGNLFHKTSFGHTGFTGTSVWVDPERNLFVIFLTNRIYPSRENKKIYKFRPLLHDAIVNSIE